MNVAVPSVLVVDDELDTCRNLSDILTDLGYRVDTAYDGPAALELVRRHAAHTRAECHQDQPVPRHARECAVRRALCDL